MLGDQIDALWNVDRATGVAARVHDVDRFGVGEDQPDGLEWDGWRLWLVGGVNDALHRLDTTTGIAIRVGDTHRFGQDLDGGGELAWDGRRLLMLRTEGATTRLYDLDRQSGARHRYRHGRRAGRSGRRPGVGGRSMTGAIDLSRLARPEIEGLRLSIDDVHAEILAWLAQQYEWTLTVDGSDPAWRLSRLWAARETLIRQAIADSLAQASLAFAEGGTSTTSASPTTCWSGWKRSATTHTGNASRRLSSATRSASPDRGTKASRGASPASPTPA